MEDLLLNSKKLLCILLLLLSACSNTIKEVDKNESITPLPSVQVETIDVELFKELPDSDGITIYQNHVAVCDFNNGLQYYLVSLDGKSSKLLLDVPNAYETTAVSTEEHLYVTAIVDEGEKQYIYSCTQEKCDIIKEDLTIWSNDFYLVNHQNKLYLLQYVSEQELLLSFYDTKEENWIEFERFQHNAIIGNISITSNQEYLLLSYAVNDENSNTVYLYQYDNNQKDVHEIILPKSEYDRIGTYWPLIYNEHIAIPVHKVNYKSCNLLLYTEDEYAIQENTIPCYYQTKMFNKDMYISSLPGRNQSISKIYEENVDSYLIDYSNMGIVFTDNNPQFYTLDNETVMNLSNNDGKWHIIHLISKPCTYSPSLQDTYLLDTIEITINKEFTDKYPQLSIAKEENSYYLEYVTCNTTFTIQELHIMPLDEYNAWIEQMVDGILPVIYQQIEDYVLVGDPWDILSGQSLPAYNEDTEYNKALDEYKEFLLQFPDEKFELISKIKQK